MSDFLGRTVFRVENYATETNAAVLDEILRTIFFEFPSLHAVNVRELLGSAVTHDVERLNRLRTCIRPIGDTPFAKPGNGASLIGPFPSRFRFDSGIVFTPFAITVSPQLVQFRLTICEASSALYLILDVTPGPFAEAALRDALIQLNLQFDVLIAPGVYQPIGSTLSVVCDKRRRTRVSA